MPDETSLRPADTPTSELERRPDRTPPARGAATPADALSPERCTIPAAWSGTRSDDPLCGCLHQLFEEQAERTPDDLAVVAGDEQLTYRQLDALADRLASRLRGSGVDAEMPVGLAGDRSIATLVGLLGILKAGGAYVPFPESGPGERLDAIARDAGLGLVVTGGGPVPSGIGECRLVPALLERAEDVRFGEDRGPCRARPGGLACVIYTSGSTGEPKGVCVEHRGLVNLMTFRVGRQFDPSYFRVAALTSPIQFDASITQIFSPLITGGLLIIASGLDALIASEWYDRLTAFTGAATVLGGLVERRRLPASVQLVAVGGEPVPAALLEAVEAHPTVERFDTLYGLTECSGYSTTAILVDRRAGREPVAAAMSDRGRDLRLIGRPIAETRVDLLDAELQPVPDGEPGELFIGGVGLARGFLNRPAETARCFIASPFAAGDRLYRTGDLARRRPDGQLEFLGRMDRQVKLHGYRIELGEIEAALGSHPSVAGCAVIVRASASGGDPRLVAYHVPRSGVGPADADLASWLRERLPGSMVPSVFVSLPALPLTPNGKVDHRALADVPDPPCEPARGSCPPRTEIERQLAADWAELLRVPSVGIRDNFFDLGGHSLLALELLARIEARYGVRLTLASMFRDGTIEDLAPRLSGADRNASHRGIVELQRGALGRRRLFIVPTMGGEVLFARSLVHHLGAATPVSGFQPDLSEEIAEETSGLEETAGRYVEVLQRFQSRGPYAIAGYSFGGFLAYEIARQLRERGDEVDLLAIVDEGPTNRVHERGRGPWHRVWLARLRNLPAWFRDDAMRSSPRLLMRRARHRLRTLAQMRIARIRGRPELPELGDAFDADRVPPRTRRMIAASFRQVFTYAPEPYAGRVTLFAARTRPLLCGADRDLGWGRLARGGVNVLILPGRHEDLVREPYVRELARKVKDALAACRPAPDADHDDVPGECPMDPDPDRPRAGLRAERIHDRGSPR